MNYETIRSALFAIPPDDREVWYRMASALKRELGETEGFALWDEWSRQWSDYRESHARRTWRSAAKEGSGRQVTLGSLFYIARQWGWTGDIVGEGKISKAERARIEAERREERDRVVRGQRKAADQAEAMLRASRMETHGYLAAKGFEDFHMPVLGERLLVPMRDAQDLRVWSVQTILASGEKRFLPGSRAGGLTHTIGSGRGPKWLCEGIATALSVHSAVRRMGLLEDVVVVCFAAANIENVSARVCGAGDVVVADRDMYRCAVRGCGVKWSAPWGRQRCPKCTSRWVVEPAGERYARRSNLPYWLPPELGDANDFMVSAGLSALCDSLGDFLKNRTG